MSPFKAGKGIPLELNPAVGRELAEEALDLPPADKGYISRKAFIKNEKSQFE